MARTKTKRRNCNRRKYRESSIRNMTAVAYRTPFIKCNVGSNAECTNPRNLPIIILFRVVEECRGGWGAKAEERGAAAMSRATNFMVF